MILCKYKKLKIDINIFFIIIIKMAVPGTPTYLSIKNAEIPASFDLINEYNNIISIAHQHHYAVLR